MASYIERRKFLATLGGAAAAWPLAARAQQTDRVWRIGLLMAWAESDPEAPPRMAAFMSRLRELGWIEPNVRPDDSRLHRLVGIEPRIAKPQALRPPGQWR